MTVELAFLGAAGTVTGSKYLVQAGGKSVLVDCGLFQGLKALRLRNWSPPLVLPQEVDALVLTHAHLDHSGYLPLFVKKGFKGPVLSSPGTRDLCGILLPDSGHLQEEEARYANKRGFSKHKPALPLYTEDDARESLKRFLPIPFREEKSAGAEFELTLYPAGHILGASIAALHAGGLHLIFSGDLGRLNDPIMRRPRRSKKRTAWSSNRPTATGATRRPTRKKCSAAISAARWGAAASSSSRRLPSAARRRSFISLPV